MIKNNYLTIPVIMTTNKSQSESKTKINSEKKSVTKPETNINVKSKKNVKSKTKKKSAKDKKELNSESQEFKKMKLKDLMGKKFVLYFYPKDSTPGCTLEGQEFSKLYNQFKKWGVQIFGVSRDSVKSHHKFKCKYEFPFELLSDENEELCRAFDVIKEKNMYGKKVMGIERSTFLLDEKGKIIHEWRKVKAEGHAADVLNFISNLS